MVYGLQMPKTRAIPVRLSDDLCARLDASARKLGTDRAKLIRLCVETWVDQFERLGYAVLPPDWRDIMASFDGRRNVSSGNADNDDSDEAVLRRIFRSEHEAAAKARRPAKRRSKPGGGSEASGRFPAGSKRSDSA